MLTARTPFHGETAAEVMASVMIRDADLSALPANLNPRIPELIKRCLDKQPKKRWQAMGDLRRRARIIGGSPFHTAQTIAATPQPLWRRASPIVAAVTRLSMLVPSPAPAVTRFTVPAENIRIATPSLALSADGPMR